MNNTDLIAFIQTSVLQRGEFTLVSGAKSSFYLNMKLATFHPRGSRLIAEAILEVIADLDVDSVGGLDMGSTPISASVATLSDIRGKPVRAFTVRKSVKEHGTRQRIEGCFVKGDRVVIVDDVITTGGSIVQAIEVVREAGAEVALAVSVVDRAAGGEERFAALGIPYRPLVRLSDLGVES